MFEDRAPIDTRSLFAPERVSLLGVLNQLTPDQWQIPTVCPGWSVHDVAVHLLWGDISNLSRRRDGYAGRRQDDHGERDSIERLIAFVNNRNEDWIVGARRMSPAIATSLLSVTGSEFADFVLTVDIQEMGPGIGWTGPDVAPVWLDVAREFTERWVHQQHIRDAVGKPGLKDQQFLKPVLATFMMALPFALSKVDLSVETTADVFITGDSGGFWRVRKSSRSASWTFAEADETAPNASVLIDQDLAWRLFTKGLSPPDAVSSVDAKGDERIVEAILNMVTILA